MDAMCWCESTLPIHEVDLSKRAVFIGRVKEVLDSADGMVRMLHEQVQSAWFSKPGRVDEPAVTDSFWEATEHLFYEVLNGLSVLHRSSPEQTGEAKDEKEEISALIDVYKVWLRETRCMVFRLFDQWVLSAPIEEQNMRRVVQARATLGRYLNSDEKLKPLWDIVDPNRGKKAEARGKSKS